MRRLCVPLVVLAALLAPAHASAENPKLVGTVGPGPSISLTRDGQLVRQLAPGTYDITVRDLATEHNFHLFGPGVNQTTSVEGTGTFTWTVTFREGRYQYLCDPHPYDMVGAFVVGTAQPAPPPAPAPKRLTATVGPASTIALRSATGGHLHSLKAGVYVITVRDRTRLHNFHLVGRGVNRRTTLAGMGTFTWRVTLRKGKLTFYSDRTPLKLRGAVTVR